MFGQIKKLQVGKLLFFFWLLLLIFKTTDKVFYAQGFELQGFGHDHGHGHFSTSL